MISSILITMKKCPRNKENVIDCSTCQFHCHVEYFNEVSGYLPDESKTADFREYDDLFESLNLKH
jgi:hypothetical protein